MKAYVLISRSKAYQMDLSGDELEERVIAGLRGLERRSVVSFPTGQGPGPAYWSSFYILCPGDIWPESDARVFARMWSRDFVEYEWDDSMIMPILEATPEEY